jgi:glycerophosphoryl diester phosphodiesterase
VTDAQHAIQVVAHRGASEEAPEHTLAAYRKAIEDGADALECDVRLTADGHLVCVHDRRVDRTSNGRGPVSALELSELAALDFGSWKRSEKGADAPGWEESPDWYDADRAEDTSVLTLERLLELIADSGRRIELAIETKHPTRWAGQVEQRLLATLRRFGLDAPSPARGAPDGAYGETGTYGAYGAYEANGVYAAYATGGAPVAGGARREPGAYQAWPVRIMSFSARSLQRIRIASPYLPTVYLMQYISLRHREGRLPAGVHIAGLSVRIVRGHPGYVAKLQKAGHKVHVWTVNDDADVDLCASLGIEAIITNRPKQVLRRLGRA